MGSDPAAVPAPRPAERRPVTHETIDATGCGEPMKAALHLVLDGTPYREAAREAGLASHQDLYRAAKKLGLAEVYSAQLVAQSRRIAHLSGHDLERRLVEDPESIPTKDLAVVDGITLDKVAKYEGWGRDSSAADGGGHIIDRLAALEGKVTLNVTYERTKSDAGPPPIDVTPSKIAG